MSTILSAGVGFETVGVEVRGGLDDQGKPAYAAPVSIQARVVRESILVPLGDGSVVRSMATLWVDAAQAVLPNEQDRLTLVGNVVTTVVTRKERRKLNGVLDHVWLQVRLGG